MNAEERSALDEWRAIVPLVRGMVEGLSEQDLDRRSEESALTVRETVHHVVEANVVASSIVVAALGSPGCIYDWSWMMPFGQWLDRLDYRSKPVAPSLRLLEALNAWIATQVEPLPDGLQRTVRLRDAPEAELRAVTVAQVLLQEASHAREHCRTG